MKSSKQLHEQGVGLDPSRLDPGMRHSPDISRRHLAVPFTDFIGDEHLEALESRIPIVSEGHIQSVKGPLRPTVYPDKVVEESRSAHGVGFGAFRVRDRSNSFVKLALKPFNHYEKAANEADGYLWLGGLSILTYEPFGIFPAEHGDHFIGMTRTRKDLDSLDRDTWIKGGRVTSAREQEIHERNERTVEDIAKCLGEVHANGGFLPDSQIKNWAVSPEGKIGPIDTENFRREQLGDDRVPQLAWEDIEMLMKSLILSNSETEATDRIFGVGMFSGMGLRTVRNSIERLFIESYAAKLGEIMSTTEDPAMVRQCDLLFSGVLTRFYSDTDWPQAFIDQQNAQKAFSASGK